MHELAVKTKALVQDFYGTAQRYAYWDGFSTGGRQGYKIAQTFPDDYDGILAGAPAINWSRFITAELYPQIVMLRDLGAAIPEAKLNAANAAAGVGLRRYRPRLPARPAAVPVRPDDGRRRAVHRRRRQRRVIGTDPDTGTCLSSAEAAAINKIWYGQTVER